jgi:hypothetical protein
MIDSELNPQVDSDLIKACRGNVLLNDRTVSASMVNSAKTLLSSKGYQDEATLVSAKLKELQCPMPAVSVMNE